MDLSGILQKWADRYGIEVSLERIDYRDAIDSFSSGKYDACTMRNIDALTGPAAKGVDTTVLFVTGVSNGSDVVVLRNGSTLDDLRGRRVKLITGTVSHYLLLRGLEGARISATDITLVNSNEKEIVSEIKNNPSAAVVTWNPLYNVVEEAQAVYDSSEIAGEIFDLMVAHTDAPETFKKALTGAWYEAITDMSDVRPRLEEEKQFIIRSSTSVPEGFRSFEKSADTFLLPREAADFVADERFKSTMEFVRTFIFENGLYERDAIGLNTIGIEFTDSSILGDPQNIKLRFLTNYMNWAAGGAVE